MNSTLILLICLGLLVVYGITMFNSLIARRNEVDNSFSSVDVLLKKRHDLIPNLVAAVKQYMTHERHILEEVTRLRSKLQEGGMPQKERFATENKLGSMLGEISVAVEAYPELKANTSMMQLQMTLNEVEEQISAARRAYNAAVLALNNAIEMFPTNLLAGPMRITKRDFFEAEATERENVNVGELFGS